MAAPRTSSRVEPALDLDGACAGGGDRLVGRARLGRRTKLLTARLEPGDIAVIDHPELDRLSAEALVASGVRCVVNAARSPSARYPNLGPSVLVEGGVALVDAPGAALFETLADGDEVVVDEGRVLRDGRAVARGSVLDRAAVRRALEHGRTRVDASLDEFVTNTLSHLRAERELLCSPLELPDLRTELRGRPALVVARGPDSADDVRALAGFVRRRGPALVAVDGGADVLAGAGLRADLIVGDMDSVSDAALGGGAELVVHAYCDGAAPGASRLAALGLEHRRVATPGTSEDAALLLAAEGGARPVVCVGSGLGLVDLLDRGRPGMASTLLTRLRLGELLVDARGVATLLA